jgi:hypothetical protein
MAHSATKKKIATNICVKASFVVFLFFVCLGQSKLKPMWPVNNDKEL